LSQPAGLMALVPPFASAPPLAPAPVDADAPPLAWEPAPVDALGEDGMPLLLALEPALLDGESLASAPCARPSAAALSAAARSFVFMCVCLVEC
jgi:hypothetical protein